MSAIPKPRKLTVAEYLAIDSQAEVRSEFINGEMVEMARASFSHNFVKSNLVGEVGGRLKGGSCRTMSSTQRVLVRRTNCYVYPDVLIVCGKREFDPGDPNTLLNPVVVFEVLSPSTEAYDRGTKFRQYQRLASVNEIVLVSQAVPLVQVFARQDNGLWLLSSFDDMAGEFALTSVPLTIPLADVYRDVEWPEESSGTPEQVDGP